MSEELLDSTDATGTNERPTFLTVLIILTWVGSGIGLVSSLINMGQPYVPMWYTLALVAINAVTAYAAWQMWNLNKQGLMIYTAAEGLGVILPFIFVYAILGGAGPFAAAMASTLLLMSIFPIAFIVMYWINAKHLK